MQQIQEPNWQPMSALPASVPIHLREWLTEDVSLTMRLRQQGEFKVNLLQEGWCTPEVNEAQLLQIEQDTNVWFRDVVLSVDENPWVIAHTLIPLSTLNTISELKNLGEQSLGDLIFNKLRGVREMLEFAQLKPTNLLFKLTESINRTKNKTFWARRSLICVQHQHLIINEAFIFGD